MPASFQTLPRPVIDKALGYFRAHLNKWSVVHSLLWTCRSWRSVTLYFLCQIYEIHFSSDSIEYPFTDWPTGLEKVLSYSPSWFRSLNITVEIPITTTTFGSMLRSNNKLLLDNASSVTLCLSHFPNRSQTEQDMQNSVANTELLLKYLAQVAPNVANVTLVDYYPGIDKTIFTSKHLQLLNQFLSSVSGMAKKQLITLINGSSEIKGLTSFDAGQDGLVHIELTGWLQPQGFALIRRCAATLKKLFLHEHGVNRDFTGLLVDDNGEYVAYPNLISLYIHAMLTAQANQRFPASFVPFPRLRKLELPISYPYADNVLFRGNQQTIQTLSMELSRPLVKILTKCRVFTNSSHPNLQIVSLMDRTELLTQCTETDTIELIANLTQHSWRAKISKENYNGKWLAPFEAFKGIFGSARTMEIGDPYMVFTDIMRLLQMLPNLTRLNCFSLEVGIELEILREIGASKQPLSRNLEILHISSVYDSSVTEMVVAIITLVILCPNLKRMVVPFDTGNGGFKEEWDKTLAQEEYVEQAPKIRSMLAMPPSSYK